MCASTSAGRFTRAMAEAMLKVLPLPVTPRRTWCLSPRARPAVSSSMAAGWSPLGSNSLTSSKRVSAWVGAMRVSAMAWRQLGSFRVAVSFLAAGIGQS